MEVSGLDRRERALKIITLLRTATKEMVEPSVSQIIRDYGQDPFLVLVSCLLSLRTKDTVSLPASHRVFAQARTPQQLLSIPTHQLSTIIYPVGFYRQKARQLHALCRVLIATYNGAVPNTEEHLLALPGVGRKTANLVLSLGFGIPAICVDTHVHRISNRLGLVTTDTAEQTEHELKKLLPPRYWAEYNSLLVMWGQNICVPISPRCSQCAVFSLCPRVGVTSSR